MKVQDKRFRFVGTMLLFATASFAQQVKTDYDRTADFSQYKTDSWENLHTQDPLWVDSNQSGREFSTGREGLDSGGIGWECFHHGDGDD